MKIELDEELLGFEPPSTLDTLGYIAPSNLYHRAPVPNDFAAFLLQQNAAPALLAWRGRPGVYICGGTVRAYHNWKLNLDDAKIRDVDLYFSDETEYEKAYNVLTSIGLEEVARTDRAVTLIQDDTKPALQLVKFVFGTIQEVLNEFDYTIVKAGASSSEMVTYKEYEEDLEDRVLRYCGSQLPMSSLARAIKYARYGYKLPAADMVAILIDIRDKVDLNDPLSVAYHVNSFDPASEEAKNVREVTF